jgi:hypothetical protein
VSARAIELTFRGLRRDRPPKLEVALDAILRLAGTDAGWWVLPLAAAPSGPPARRTLHTVDLYELSGNGHVVIAAFRGEGPFCALSARAPAEVRLTGLPIAWWGPEPDRLELEASTAAGVLVGGRPLAEYFTLELQSDSTATVDAAPLADQREVVASIGGGGAGAELTVELVDERSETVVVPLSGAAQGP